MSNTFKVIDMVTKEALRIAHEKLTFIGTVDLQYDESFKNNGQGKIGSTLRVREPNQYIRRQGSRIMDVQDQAETSQTITVATQDGVDMKFNSQELTQSVNNGAAFDDLSKNYIEPAVSVLTSGIEGDFLEFATKAVSQTVGTAGTAITTLSVPGSARAKLNQQLAPKDKRCIQMDSVTMGGLVNGVAAYFNPSNAVSKQYREGFVARTAMADYYENERTWSMTTGDDVAGAIDESTETNFVQGAILIHVDALGTTALKGSVFTFADMFDCHPETKAAYPHLKQFVLTADAVIGGNEADLVFSPAIYTTGAKKNVATSTGADITWTSTAQDGKVVTFVGLASSTYVQPLMYHPEAFQFITADLPQYEDTQKCVVKEKDGLSIRCWMGSDIRNDELLLRLDILYGMAALRPEWACRMIGAKSA
jgi:hypothetical protein